ncbi:transglycosylase SLT domain-containing protein [Salipaludibacillus aurantiacus]|uniref:Transglycosylase SLT domain-containing protein n=1 Tax=Salipaludibacillus aurantiacus TaxID=1601833 RepID=A0A1H9RAG1_9BACI|nr:transglycosylase SLT domain-containing protein [Salipaludibacillus aurantiacus]SER69535.1 Transglycosylase SLT domain-containing protein [Salipaludibacillus aurantiacus]
MRIRTLIMIVAIAALAGSSIVLANEYRQTKEKIKELEVAKEEQRKQQARDLEIERMKRYAGQLPEDYEVSGYENWNEAKQVADYLYEDSGGLFKEEWGLFLALEAQKKEINPFLVYELLKVETGGQFDPELVGPETKYGHAYGMAQFMKNTGPWIAEMAGLQYEDDMLFDPHYSIQLSIVYLDYLYEQYGDWDHALTAYHRGMYGLEQYIEDNGDAKSWYAVEIQENAQEFDLVAYEN